MKVCSACFPLTWGQTSRPLRAIGLAADLLHYRLRPQLYIYLEAARGENWPRMVNQCVRIIDLACIQSLKLVSNYDIIVQKTSKHIRKYWKLMPLMLIIYQFTQSARCSEILGCIFRLLTGSLRHDPRRSLPAIAPKAPRAKLQKPQGPPGKSPECQIWHDGGWHR